jgi:pSer/pThr/pTyr-binding forkhead associated (FHA) protein
MLRLIIHPPDGSAYAQELSGVDHHIGRDSGNGIVVKDPRISRQHCHIFHANGAYYIEDLNSQSGLRVNGCGVEGQTRIESGDRITLGDTWIEVVSNDSRAVTTLGATNEQKGSGPQEQQVQKSGDDVNPTRYLPTRIADLPRLQHNYRLIQLFDGRPGRAHSFDRGLLCLGRSLKCDIQMTQDSSVSSFHAVLTLDENECVLKDLNSKNGTYVNGRRIRQTKCMKNGDRIAVGETQFVFCNRNLPFSDEQAHFNRASGRQPSGFIIRSKMLIAACLLLAALAGMGFWYFWGGSLSAAESKPQMALATDSDTEPSVISELSDRYRFDISLSSALQYEHKRLWEEAIRIYREVLESDSRHAKAQDGIHRCETEMENREHYEAGLVSYEKGAWSKAIESFNRIDEESRYFSEAGSRIEAAKAKKSSVAVDRKAKEGGRRPDSEADAHIQSALEHYLNGFLKPAMETLDLALEKRYISDKTVQDNIKRVRTAIRQIGQMTEEGKTLYEEGKVDDAFTKWEAALQLDREIVGTSPSAYAQKIGMYVADELCGRAETALKTERYDDADSYAEMAENASPGHRGARKVHERVSAWRRKVQVRELFEDAEIIKDIDTTAAIEKWEQIVAMSPENSAFHQRARGLLNQYQNGGAIWRRTFRKNDG